MSETSRLSGRCLCGAVRFTGVPSAVMHACHCEACRRMSGGVFLGVDCGDTVQIEDAAALATYSSSDWAERQFCATCGSSLFWRLKAGGMTVASIQAFDEPARFVFDSELFIEAKPATYDFHGDRTRLTGEEVAALYD